MWQKYITPATPQEAVSLLAKEKNARIIAGGTDLVLEIERGLRPNTQTLIDISRIPGLDKITLDQNDTIHIGATVTHNHVAGSKLLRERAYPLARACWEVGANQIRNRATVAGNLITASPANDTITPLMALGASLTLLSPRGERKIPLDKFYKGVRKTVMADDEMLVEISFPAMKENQRGTFIKLGLRRAQAISIVNAAIILDLNLPRINSASITLGAVAPTIIHAKEAETYLKNKDLSEETIAKTAELAMTAAHPIDDIRATAAYRREMIKVITARGLRALREGSPQDDFPREPILLWGKKEQKAAPPPDTRAANAPILTTINGKKYLIEGAEKKTLLAVLRDEIGLMGTKEGCGEGECGACTVYLDGKAVMSCLVPAPRAHGAEITTIEGIADSAKEQLHPVQEAFIHEGAVQCGYCTPGFIMSAAKLLEEEPNPKRSQIEEAIAGNLCRCTGYYKIVTAIETASKKGQASDG